MNPETQRQQVLYLWTGDSSMTSKVVAWTFHDGNDPDADLVDRPYRQAVDALADGWRLVQSSQLLTRPLGDEHVAGVLEFEWLFERIVELAIPARASPAEPSTIEETA